MAGAGSGIDPAGGMNGSSSGGEPAGGSSGANRGDGDHVRVRITFRPSRHRELIAREVGRGERCEHPSTRPLPSPPPEGR